MMRAGSTMPSTRKTWRKKRILILSIFDYSICASNVSLPCGKDTRNIVFRHRFNVVSSTFYHHSISVECSCVCTLVWFFRWWNAIRGKMSLLTFQPTQPIQLRMIENLSSLFGFQPKLSVGSDSAEMILTLVAWSRGEEGKLFSRISFRVVHLERWEKETKEIKIE